MSPGVMPGARNPAQNRSQVNRGHEAHGSTGIKKSSPKICQENTGHSTRMGWPRGWELPSLGHGAALGSCLALGKEVKGFIKNELLALGRQIYLYW